MKKCYLRARDFGFIPSVATINLDRIITQPKVSIFKKKGYLKQKLETVIHLCSQKEIP